MHWFGSRIKMEVGVWEGEVGYRDLSSPPRGAAEIWQVPG